MALRQTTQSQQPEAKLLVLPSRAAGVRRDAVNSDGIRSPAVQTEEAVMDQSLSDRSESANRKLRGLIILATASAWIAIAFAIRLIFF